MKNMPNQILPSETWNSSNRKTNFATIALAALAPNQSVTLSNEPSYHARARQKPRHAPTKSVPAFGEIPYWAITTPPSPRIHRVDKREVKTVTATSTSTGKKATKPSKQQPTFLQALCKRAAFLHYCVLLIILANTAGILTNVLVKVLTSHP